jgi:hypothetical protein
VNPENLTGAKTMDRKLSPAWQWGVVLLLVVTLPLTEA